VYSSVYFLRCIFPLRTFSYRGIQVDMWQIISIYIPGSGWAESPGGRVWKRSCVLVRRRARHSWGAKGVKKSTPHDSTKERNFGSTNRKLAKKKYIVDWCSCGKNLRCHTWDSSLPQPREKGWAHIRWAWSTTIASHTHRRRSSRSSVGDSSLSMVYKGFVDPKMGGLKTEFSHLFFATVSLDRHRLLHMMVGEQANGVY